MIKPLLATPAMCTLRELQDGTYSIEDLETLHQIMELKEHMKSVPILNQP